MTRIGWWLAGAISRMLDPPERDAAWGDIVESGEGALRAIGDMAGLVARRQAQVWMNWRPWLALTALALPFGMRLGAGSVALGRTFDLYFWIIGNRQAIDPALLRTSGISLNAGLLGMALGALLLASWSVSSALVLGQWSGRAAPVNGILFFAALLAGGLAIPQSLGMWLPLTLLAALVLVPAAWGMLRGSRGSVWPPIPLLLWTAIVAVAAVAAYPRWGWWWNWPVAYLALDACRHRWNWRSIRR